MKFIEPKRNAGVDPDPERSLYFLNAVIVLAIEAYWSQVRQDRTQLYNPF